MVDGSGRRVVSGLTVWRRRMVVGSGRRMVEGTRSLAQ